MVRDSFILTHSRLVLLSIFAGRVVRVVTGGTAVDSGSGPIRMRIDRMSRMQWRDFCLLRCNDDFGQKIHQIHLRYRGTGVQGVVCTLKLEGSGGLRSDCAPRLNRLRSVLVGRSCRRRLTPSPNQCVSICSSMVFSELGSSGWGPNSLGPRALPALRERRQLGGCMSENLVFIGRPQKAPRHIQFTGDSGAMYRGTLLEKLPRYDAFSWE